MIIGEKFVRILWLIRQSNLFTYCHVYTQVTHFELRKMQSISKFPNELIHISFYSYEKVTQNYMLDLYVICGNVKYGVA